MKKQIFTAVLLAAGIGTASISSAASIGSLLGGFNVLSDESAEAVYRDSGNGYTLVTPDAQGNITLMVDDILRGVLSISDIDTTPVATTGHELTAIFETKVTSILDSTNSDNATLSATCGSFVCYEFGPSGTFAPSGFAVDANAVIAFYEDSTLDFDRYIGDLVTSPGTVLADIASIEASATGGDPYWIFGLVDEANDANDDFWYAGGGSATFNIGAAGTQIASFAASLTLLENPNGKDLISSLCSAGVNGTTRLDANSDACTAGGIVRTAFINENSALPAYNSVEFNINVVPEPATLGLIGLGLIGLGAATRRKKQV